MEYHLLLPLKEEDRIRLKAGDKVFLTGEVYGMRDQAHKRILELLERGEDIPIDLNNSCIFYVGPTEAKPGDKVGSIGPTTSSRMDPFTPKLISYGVRVIIGKGRRNKDVIEAIKKYRAVYLVSPGGVSAYLRQFVSEIKIVAFQDLGPEAIYILKLKDFPTFVSIDTGGNFL